MSGSPPVGSARPALTEATVTALANDGEILTLLGGARVWVNVPQETTPPYLWVLAGDEVPEARSMSNRMRRMVDLEVTAVSAYRGTAEIDALLSRVIELLDPGPAVAGYTAGWAFAINKRPVQADTVSGQVVWLGTAVFRVRLT